MTQVLIIPGAGMVTLQIFLIATHLVDLETLLAGHEWLTYPIFAAVFVASAIAWAYSPLPDGTTFNGTYGTGWGFGSSED